MSVSTRTAQRTLGFGQFGSMLVLLAVMAVVVAAIAFGTIGAKKADVAPATGGFPPPVIRDLGSRDISGTPVGSSSGASLPSSAAHPSGKAPVQNHGSNGPRLQPR
jgi:hypothetical protein